MNKQNFAFGKWNYILLAVGAVAIILGFLLMMGPSSTETHFEPDIFSFRRIKLAPAICFFGFVFVIFAIMYKGKQNSQQLQLHHSGRQAHRPARPLRLRQVHHAVHDLRPAEALLR